MNIGVIGTGQMGKNHLRVLNGLKNRIEGISIFDTDAERLHQLARIYDANHHHNLYSLLEEADAVIIATPTLSHYKIAEECIKLKKDVLIEKPVTATVDEAARLTELVEKTGSLCMVGHIERFNPAILYTQEYIADKAIRNITSERISKLEKGRRFDVNVVIDLMIHDIDIVLSMVDSRPEKIFAAACDRNVDTAQAVIQFENGVVATFNASRSSSEKIRRLSVYTSEESIRVDFLKYRVDRVRQESTVKSFCNCNYSITGREESVTLEGEPLYLELKHFLDCIQSGEKPASNERNGFEALKVAEYMTNYIKEGR